MSFFTANKKFWIMAGGLLGLAFLLLVFQAGFSIGARKGFFTCRWNEHYHQNFGGPGFIQSHGAFGRVLRVETDSLIIKDPAGVEKIIEVATGTDILRGPDRITLSEVMVDEDAVVIGQPTDDGRVHAELIRLMPPRR